MPSRKLASRVVLAALALVVLAIASAAFADAPKAAIRGPARVGADGTIVLDARASVADRPLRWKLDGPDVPFLVADQEGRKGVILFVPSAPAGIYRFTLIARGIPPGEVELDADAAIWVVTVDGGPPVDPRPPPNPEPDKPKPVPVTTGTLNVSLVVDLDTITPEVARLREGFKVRETFKSIDATYRTYASTSPDLARLNLTKALAETGLPACIIQDQAGRILWSGRAPPDEDGLISLTKTFRGAK